jgi:hypothetical protein
VHRRERCEGRDLEDEPDGERNRAGEERLRGAVEPPPERREQDKRRERQEPQVQVELGDVVEEPLQDGADRVVLVAGGLVGAERRAGRVAARELHRDYDNDRGAEDPVQPAKGEQAPPGLAPPPGQQRRRRDERRHERHGLRARGVRERADREQDELAREGRPLQARDERERRTDEDRVEGVLGHDRPGVERRGDGDGEQRGEERERRRHHAAGEEVRRHRRQRHQYRVDRLGGGVGLRHRGVEPVRGADQYRVDEPVGAARLAADEEVPCGGEALRELGVDELVDHDPGRDHAPAEAPANDRRRDDQAREPEPGGERTGDRGCLGAKPRARGVSRQASPR